MLDAHRLDERIAQLKHRYGPGYRITTTQLQPSEEPEYDALPTLTALINERGLAGAHPYAWRPIAGTGAAPAPM